MPATLTPGAPKVVLSGQRWDDVQIPIWPDLEYMEDRFCTIANGPLLLHYVESKVESLLFHK